MFQVCIAERTPTPCVRQAAVPLLANIIRIQASLALADVRRRRNYLHAEIAADTRNRLRILQVDLERADWLLGHLDRMRATAELEAEIRLDPLLRLVGGPVHALELARDTLGAQVAPEHACGQRLRILLVPDENARRRVQIQDLRRADAQALRDAAPRCYGDTGLAYMGWALNRLELHTLILVTLAYLRLN